MIANSAHSPAEIRLADNTSVDDLDAAICRLARQMNADAYRMLALVRDFDDRFGWTKWGFRNCAEWLAWRCGLSLSAAREKVRIAHALRMMPSISQAFAEGRLSYSKVRALTRVVEAHDEDLLLAYALKASAAQVEERCRQIRNSDPESVGGALRAWQRRALTLIRNEARAVVTISVEVQIEQGEVIAKALERAVAAGETATGIEFAATRDAVRDACEEPHRRATVGGRSRRIPSWRSRKRIYRAAPAVRRGPLQRPINTRSSCTSTIPPSAEGRGGPIFRSIRSSASRATVVSLPSSRTRTARRSTSAVSGAR